MTRRRHNYFPHDPGYDFGDANHLPIVPAAVETPPDASQEETEQPPVPGDAGKGESNP